MGTPDNPTGSDITDYWEGRGNEFVEYHGESFYTVTSLPLYVFRRGLLLELVDCMINKFLKEGDRILDFGCGDGFYSNWIKQKYPSMEVYGCDLSANMIGRARANAEVGQNDVVFKVSDSGIPFNQRFDMVLIVAVLAHIMNQNQKEEVIENISDHLVDDGLVCLFERTGGETPKKGDTYQRDYLETYIDLFEKNGFETLSVQSVQFPLFEIIDKFLRLLFKMSQLVWKSIGTSRYSEDDVGRNDNLNNDLRYVFLSEKIFNFTLKIDKGSKLTRPPKNTFFLLKKYNKFIN